MDDMKRIGALIDAAEKERREIRDAEMNVHKRRLEAEFTRHQESLDHIDRVFRERLGIEL
jgi:hypothetical protein